ncbi:hypothetical protein B0J14DRAFT_451367, partial [Halenospora varia]
TTTHGNPYIICPPASGLDIFIFFLGNYFAHAARVTTRPGATALEGFAIAVLALLFPASGWIQRYLGTKVLVQTSVQSELRIEARAGTLCTLRRTKKWRPR